MSDLPRLLARLATFFPPERPLALRPSAGPEAWAPLAERFREAARALQRSASGT
ncbi:MAG TPA: hypothetical protein VIL20_05230 [Sandaracinaceae bacterium]